MEPTIAHQLIEGFTELADNLEDQQAMSAGDMERRYREVCGELESLLEERNAATPELNQLILETKQERKRLSIDYRQLTGNDLAKESRNQHQINVDKAMNKLLSAIGVPAYLPTSDPIVQRRLQELADALIAKGKFNGNYVDRK